MPPVGCNKQPCSSFCGALCYYDRCSGVPTLFTAPPIFFHLYHLEEDGRKIMTVSQTSAYNSTCTSHPLCLALNSEERARMHSLLLHMSLTHPVWFWPRHKCFKGMSTSPWGSKGLHIRDPLCAKGSVPLNPAALMCHIVAPFSSLIPTLSLSPMEVISRALFLPDQRVGGHYELPCPMRNSNRGSLEMAGIGLGYTASTVGVSRTTRVKTMMNDGATMASLKIWDVQHGPSYG